MIHNIETNKLIPEDDMILFNCVTYSKLVLLGSLDTIENWQEVPISQYQLVLRLQRSAS